MKYCSKLKENCFDGSCSVHHSGYGADGKGIDITQYQQDERAGVQMPKTNEREWEKEFDRLFPVTESQKHGRQEIVSWHVKQFVEKVEAQTIARCADTTRFIRPSRPEGTFARSLDFANGYNQAVEDIATAINNLIK